MIQVVGRHGISWQYVFSQKQLYPVFMPINHFVY